MLVASPEICSPTPRDESKRRAQYPGSGHSTASDASSAPPFTASDILGLFIQVTSSHPARGTGLAVRHTLRHDVHRGWSSRLDLASAHPLRGGDGGDECGALVAGSPQRRGVLHAAAPATEPSRRLSLLAEVSEGPWEASGRASSAKDSSRPARDARDAPEPPIARVATSFTNPAAESPPSLGGAAAKPVAVRAAPSLDAALGSPFGTPLPSPIERCSVTAQAVSSNI